MQTLETNIAQSANLCHCLRALIVATFLLTQAVWAGEVYGPAQVLDGDSIIIGSTNIRLHGIDAPEIPQLCYVDREAWLCGLSAKRALIEMLGKLPVRCHWAERDHYARALATCYQDGENINAKLVAVGLAVAYRRYSDRYTKVEAAARAAARGLWRSSFDSPWKWRRDHPSERKHRRAP